jgi:putative ubiquitin-RnfH superfamily antitoxin RatB of RatAB toxin-antitoxin module
MAEQDRIAVDVVYALPDRQRRVRLKLDPGASARQAVLESGLDSEFPALDLAACPLGIFGRRVADGESLRSGDRVEIYRRLPNDPHQLRRERALRGKSA